MIEESNQEVDFRLRGYNRQNYDYTSARYSLPSMKFYSNLRSIKISKLIDKNIPNSSNNSILDIGCGTGVLLKKLLSIDKESKFFGLDFSKNMLDNTVLSRDDMKRVNLCQGSAFELPFEDNKFNAVVCTRFIHQYSHELKQKLILEMRRVLKPGGILIIEFYSFLPRLIRYPISFHKIAFSEYFKHGTTMKEVESLIGSNYVRENLILPFPSFLHKILGIKNFIRLCQSIPKIGLSPIIDQFLICSRK